MTAARPVLVALVALVFAPPAPAEADPGGRGRPNGSPAVDQAVLQTGLVLPGRRMRRRFALVRPYPGRARLVGRLTAADGTPVAGAGILVLTQNHAQGARRMLRGILWTNLRGEFLWDLPPGPSREILLHYRAFERDGIDSAVASARLRVRAGVRLWVDDRRVRDGGRVTFRGRLRGRPFPWRGKLVELQARARGAWRTFATVRASPRTGRFRRRHRFRRLGFARSYPFRARVRPEDAYPYLRGTSRPVRVRVTP